MVSKTAAVVILNFNGKTFLEKFLPAVITYSAPHKVYVADNASKDGSVALLREKFPSVNIIQNKSNYGYAGGYNEALKQVEADYFILLNSDVEVTPNWIGPVLTLMESDSSIAACQPKLRDYKNRELFEYAGASGGFIDKYCYPFCRGRVFNSLESDQQQYNNSTEIFWASGACLFVKPDAFWKAGGFDSDYFAHMEEIDLCWRLKNLGYKVYVEPASAVFHVGGGTLNKFSARKTYLNFRNNLITLAKNHPPRFLFFKFIFRLWLDGVAAVKFLLSGEPKHFLAVIHSHFSFYWMLLSTLRKRRKQKQIPGFRYSLSKIYNGNIVAEHFLRGKKKFSELTRGFF